MNSFDVDVDALRSSIQLRGTVDTPEQKQRAESIAWGVPGVRTVDNRLVVKPTAGIGSAARAEIGTDASMLLPRLINNPEHCYGKMVEAQGTVDTILSRNAFTMSSAAFREKPLLVLTEESEVRDLSPGDQVRITGECQPFNRSAVAQRLNADLEERKFAEWMNKPAVLGKDVTRIKD